MYDGLSEHQGWRHLRKKIAEQQDRFAENIARRILAGGEVDQREIDFMRGYIAGAAFVIERPEVAERSLEAAARLAASFAKEALEATGDDSPYA